VFPLISSLPKFAASNKNAPQSLPLGFIGIQEENSFLTWRWLSSTRSDGCAWQSRLRGVILYRKEKREVEEEEVFDFNE